MPIEAAGNADENTKHCIAMNLFDFTKTSGGRIVALALLASGSLTSTAQAQSSLTYNGARTVLIFEPGNDLTPVPDTYGDRVTGPVDAQGNRYGPGSGGTGN